MFLVTKRSISFSREKFWTGSLAAFGITYVVGNPILYLPTGVIAAYN